MADQETTVESAASAEQQAAAKEMGWIPPEKFKGDPERFVDADEYLKRGEEVLPIVKQQLRRTREEMATLHASHVQTQEALKAATQALHDIEARHTVETQRAVDEAKAQTKAALARASEAGDHDAVAELTERMVELRKEAPAAEKKEEPKAAEVPQTTSEFEEWKEENPWYGKDRRKTALAIGIAEELRANGDKTSGRAFFDKVAEEVSKTLDAPKDPPADKVEGSRNGTGDTRQSAKKGFNALPADAKAACTADTNRFVGAGKRFKTAAEWHNYYAEVYFNSQGA